MTYYAKISPGGLVERWGDEKFDPDAVEIPAAIAEPIATFTQRHWYDPDAGAWRSIADTRTWFVDARGQRHPVAADPSWQPLFGASFDDPIVRDPSSDQWRVRTPTDLLGARIKAECSRRLYARLKDDVTEHNLTNYGVRLNSVAAADRTPAQAADVAILQAIWTWVYDPDPAKGTLAAARALVAAGEANYADDARWPAWDPAWDAMIARF